MTDNVKAAEAAPRVPKRVAAVIINSLKGGVVPRIGLPYITVGREAEIRALLTDLSLIADGGASFRFLVGRYGSGKSFLLQTIRTHAMGEGFVVADADLSPERRLQGGQGQGLATYRELMRNLSTKTRPEGGALMLILDRWISESCDMQVAGELGTGAAAPGGTCICHRRHPGIQRHRRHRRRRPPTANSNRSGRGAHPRAGRITRGDGPRLRFRPAPHPLLPRRC